MTVDLPELLHQKAREVAAAKKLSMDALITIALSQSLSRLVPDPYLEERASRAPGKGIEALLAKVPANQPPDSDRLPEGYKPKP